MSRATVRAELANAEWVPWIALLPGACTNIDKNGDTHIRTRMYQLVISQPDRTSHGMWGQLAELDQGSCSCKHTHSHRGSVSAQYEGLIKTQIIGKQRGGGQCMCVWLCLFQRDARVLRAAEHAHKHQQWRPMGGQTEEQKCTVGECERTTGHRRTYTPGHEGMCIRDICQS